MFDASQFLDSQFNESNDTVSIPCPVGEYTAMAEKVDCRQWSKKDDPTVTGVTLDIQWKIEDENVKALLGRDSIIVKQGIMLDLNQSGGLDMSKGRNIQLGRLRAALDLNTPGSPFSFNMIPGRMAKVSVQHEADRNDPEVIYARVKGVAKL